MGVAFKGLIGLFFEWNFVGWRACRRLASSCYVLRFAWFLLWASLQHLLEAKPAHSRPDLVAVRPLAQDLVRDSLEVPKAGVAGQSGNLALFSKGEFQTGGVDCAISTEWDVVADMKRSGLT